MDKISEESKHQKDKEELLKSKIKDKIKIAQNKNRYMDTDFLDLREQEIIKNEIIKNRYQNIILYGGLESSERKVLIVYTEQYEYILENIYNEVLNIIRIQNPKEYYKKYDHRTYLGALIKLGIKREKIGDTHYYTAGNVKTLEEAVKLRKQMEEKGIKNPVIQKNNK